MVDQDVLSAYREILADSLEKFVKVQADIRGMYFVEGGKFEYWLQGEGKSPTLIQLFESVSTDGTHPCWKLASCGRITHWLPFKEINDQMRFVVKMFDGIGGK